MHYCHKLCSLNQFSPFSFDVEHSLHYFSWMLYSLSYWQHHYIHQTFITWQSTQFYVKKIHIAGYNLAVLIINEIWGYCILTNFFTIYFFLVMLGDGQSGLFPLHFPTKILYAFLISPMHATWTPKVGILLYHPNNSFCQYGLVRWRDMS
jgi:hypothetical protein